jgi:short-subunit dehydrogenase
MNLVLKPAPFALNPQQVAKLSIKGLRRRKIIYAPGLLKHIFFFIRFLPRSIIYRFL